MAGSLILNVAYGVDVQSVHDPLILTIEKSIESLVEIGNPGSFLVDSFPSRMFHSCNLPSTTDSDLP